jgi:hypothetical protein
MREQFYRIFGELYNKIVEGGTNTITKSRYDAIVQNLRQCRAGGIKKTQDMKNNLKRYALASQVTNNELSRRVFVKTKRGGGEISIVEVRKKVIWYELLFDVIHEAHAFLGHPRDIRTHKNHIDNVWWGCTEEAIKIYRNLCPECLRKSRQTFPDNVDQLKFIYSETIGCRAQVDLVDFSRNPDGIYKWVMRYVDHHSGFCHVACLPNKEAVTCGNALVPILATAVMPEILHTDNGGEFTDKCINIIKEHWPAVHIVKGRARHPQSQGCVERGNATFKEALESWCSQNPKKSWAKEGVFVVTGQLNKRPSRQKANRSAYEIYYGKQGISSTSYILSNEIINAAKSEFGLLSLHELMEMVGKKNPHATIKVQDLMDIVQEADNLYDKEENNVVGDEESDGYEKLKELVKEYTDMICTREDNTPETIDTTSNHTATPIGRRSNAHNNNKTSSTPSPKSSSPKRTQRGATATQNETTNSTELKQSTQKRKRDDDSPGRKEIRQSVLNAKIKTAVAVNESRRKKAANIKVKELEINDVCTLKLDSNIKCTFRNLPVLVTEVIRSKGMNHKYKIASKHGFIKGTFLAKQLTYHEGYNSEIIQIFPAELDKSKPISIQQACTTFGGHASCTCKGDCSKSSRCSCKAAGVFCTTLCHKGRGANQKCTLFSEFCEECTDVVETK